MNSGISNGFFKTFNFTSTSGFNMTFKSVQTTNSSYSPLPITYTVNQNNLILSQPMTGLTYCQI